MGEIGKVSNYVSTFSVTIGNRAIFEHFPISPISFLWLHSCSPRKGIRLLKGNNALVSIASSGPNSIGIKIFHLSEYFTRKRRKSTSGNIYTC